MLAAGRCERVVHHVTEERLRADQAAFDIPPRRGRSDDQIRTADAVLVRLRRPRVAARARPGGVHFARLVEQQLDDAGNTRLRHEPGCQRRGLRVLARRPLALGPNRAIHVQRALGIPEQFERVAQTRVALACPARTAVVAQPFGNLREIAQAARPQRVQHRRLAVHRDGAPVDEDPARHVADEAVAVLKRFEPAQYAFRDRHQRRHALAIARVAPQIVQRMHPVQRPVGNEARVVVLDVATSRHRQHAVGPRRRAQLDVPTRETPIRVRREVDHLVHHHVARPGALFARRTVEVGVVRVEIDAATTDRPDAVQHFVAALEEGRVARRRDFARVQSLVHRDTAQNDRTRGAHRETEVAEAERLEGLEAIARAARDVAEPGALVVGIETTARRCELGGGDVDARPRRRFEIERHGAGHDFAEVHRHHVHGLCVAIERERPAQRDRGVALRALHRADHRRDGIVVRIARRNERYAQRNAVATRATEQRDRPRTQRAVRHERRLVATAEAEVVARELARGFPLRVVEVGIPPIRGERARVEDLDRQAADADRHARLPGVGAQRTPMGVGNEPLVVSELRFEQQRAGAQLGSRRHGRPPRIRAAEETHERCDRVATRSQQRREIDDVVVETAAVRAYGAARNLDAIHEERVARVRADARRHRRRYRREIETPPEARGDRVGRRNAPQRHAGIVLDSRRLAPDEARMPAPGRKHSCGDRTHLRTATESRPHRRARIRGNAGAGPAPRARSARSSDLPAAAA